MFFNIIRVFITVCIHDLTGSNFGPMRQSAVNRSPRFNSLRPRTNGEKDKEVKALRLLLHTGKKDDATNSLMDYGFIFVPDFFCFPILFFLIHLIIFATVGTRTL